MQLSCTKKSRSLSGTAFSYLRSWRYELKTPYRDGTTHVIFEPVDFIAKPAALVPKPRVNLTRFHGVFAPSILHQVWVTPAKRGKGSRKVATDQEEKTPAQRHVAMSLKLRD
jgi:hypothetical protein